jgi:hypothetical protein
MSDKPAAPIDYESPGIGARAGRKWPPLAILLLVLFVLGGFWILAMLMFGGIPAPGGAPSTQPNPLYPTTTDSE